MIMPKSAIIACLVALSLMLSSTVASADSPETVEITGAFRLLTGDVTPVFIPNRLVRLPNSLIGQPGPGGFEETFRFDDAKVDLSTGGKIRWTNTTTAPHTITFVRRSDQPRDLAAGLACFSPTGVCGATFAKHFPNGFNPATAVLDIGGVAVGDSHLVGPMGGPFRTTFQTTVDARPGTVLFYMCAFHPQMQGRVIVEGDD
jgi:plastocyanin